MVKIWCRSVVLLGCKLWTYLKLPARIIGFEKLVSADRKVREYGRLYFG